MYNYPYSCHPMSPTPPYWNQPFYPTEAYPMMQQMPSYDKGNSPNVVDIQQLTKHNHYFRTVIWTGKHLQVTLMCIGVGDDIGLEIHPHTDQFLRIEDGEGLVQIGEHKDQLTFQQYVCPGSAIMIPAGVWHNLINVGNRPLKLYSIYAPPEHPFGTIHATKAQAPV
ncbi:cupin domain-containing protein [Gracilibacillus marinus]|uniref:Cupin domain-containing protein n=1 Tax=Gracilibacillus marinus TaxID=630535 RepID=A0ABV8W1A3_9BACI